ncbi:MAG: hypothetical protein QNJ42_20935 [Crocosphaera sp.]|nr:hypothetical protein [Crocosphaera sp.]
MVEIPDPLLRRLGNPRGKAFREGRNQEPVVAKAQQKQLGKREEYQSSKSPNFK